MAIIPVEMYTAECDICKHQAEFGDFAALGDKESVKEDATAGGWYFDADGTCYCDECHKINEDGEVILKTDYEEK